MITVDELIARAELALVLVAGDSGRARQIAVPRIQKPGLALTGWPEQLHEHRVLVLGKTEIDFLAESQTARAVGLATVMESEPACVIVSRGLEAPSELFALCEAKRVPLLATTLVTADFIIAATAWMSERLAPTTEMHGVLIDVLGIGVLLTGKSGIGKSETALDLVMRGQRLVADDVVVMRRRGNAVIGRGSGILGHHMEIRGLGIINIKDLFGIASVRETKKVELAITLEEWVEGGDYERLGFDEHTDDILGVPIPAIRLPVRPGRNLATLIEVACRNQLLKVQGIHSARAFRDHLRRAHLEAGAESDAVE